MQVVPSSGSPLRLRPEQARRLLDGHRTRSAGPATEGNDKLLLRRETDKRSPFPERFGFGSRQAGQSIDTGLVAVYFRPPLIL